MTIRSDVLITMKRIEIVIDEESLGDLLGLCRTAGVRGYTFMKHAGGLGSRGERFPDDYALEEKNALLRTKVNTKACISRRIVVLRRRRCQELFARFSAFLHLHDRLPFVRCSDRSHDHAQLRPALNYNIEKRFIWTEQTHEHISHKLFCTGCKSRDIRPEYRWRRPR